MTSKEKAATRHDIEAREARRLAGESEPVCCNVDAVFVHRDADVNAEILGQLNKDECRTYLGYTLTGGYYTACGM